MWNYEKRLEFPVNIKESNADIAQVIISQYGGPDGEMGASMRYLSQRYAAPYREVAGILTDIGTDASEMFLSEANAFWCRNRIAPFKGKFIQIYIYVLSVVNHHFVK